MGIPEPANLGAKGQGQMVAPLLVGYRQASEGENRAHNLGSKYLQRGRGKLESEHRGEQIPLYGVGRAQN